MKSCDAFVVCVGRIWNLKTIKSDIYETQELKKVRKISKNRVQKWKFHTFHLFWSTLELFFISKKSPIGTLAITLLTTSISPAKLASKSSARGSSSTLLELFRGAPCFFKMPRVFLIADLSCGGERVAYFSSGARCGGVGGAPSSFAFLKKD